MQDGTSSPVLLPVTIGLLTRAPGTLALLDDAVTGATLPGVVEIDFTQSGSAGPVTTGAILLSGATVAQDVVQGGGALVTLDYTQLTVETLQSGTVVSSHSYAVPTDATVAAPPVTTATATESNVELFLKVPGLSGPETSGKVSGLFDVTGEAFAVTSGGAARPLLVTFDSSLTGSGQLGLFSDMVAGRTLSTVQLYENLAGGAETETIVLSNAVLTSDEVSGDTSTLSFDYTGATVSYGGSGTDGTTVTLPGTSAVPATPDLVPGAVSSSYMSVPGLSGEITNAGGVTNVFAMDAIADGGSGRALSPVTVEIADSSTGALGLLGDAVTGAAISGVVEIYSMQAGNVTTGAILLSGVTVVQDVVEGGGALVTLDYTKITFETLSAVSPKAPPISSATYVVTPTNPLLAAPAPTLSAASPADLLFLSAAGVSGPDTLGTSSGLFEPTGDAFAVTSGGVASPLVVTLSEPLTGPGQVDLLSGLVTGRQYATVQLSEATPSSNGTPFVYETAVLSNAVLVSDEASGGDATLVFDYGSAMVTYTPQTASGTSGTAVTVTLPGTAVAPPAATSEPGDTIGATYLHVSGLSGDVTVSGYVNDFAVSASVDGGIVPDGAGGQLDLLPVTVQLSDLSPGAQALLQDAVTGSALPGVVEIDLTRTGTSGTTVNSGVILLSGATVVQDVVEGGGALVTLDYTQLTVETLRAGQLVSSASYAVPQGGTLAAAPAPALSAALPASGDTTLKVTDVNGPVTSGTASGLLDVSGYAFAVTSGGAASPLMVTLSEPLADSGEIDLFNDLVTGHSIATVELDDVSTGSAGTGFVYERVVLSHATVMQDEQADGLTTLTFDYGSASITYTPQNADGSAGTPVSVEIVACYAGATHILTDRGEVPAEDLGIGDIVVTASGERRAIKWVGRRSYGGRFLAANPGVQPIRFSTGSLGGGLPRRDLLVSPDHAMFLDGVLIPARCLVNGSTIVRDRVERVDYFHVELDSHDVLLAEGAPSESFLDDDSRGMFHNAAEYAALYPDAPAPSGFCAPRVESGRQLEAIRQRLVAIADEVIQAA